MTRAITTARRARMAEPDSVVVAYWGEHRAQLRQSESQRAVLTNYVLAVAAALSGLVVQQRLRPGTGHSHGDGALMSQAPSDHDLGGPLAVVLGLLAADAPRRVMGAPEDWPRWAVLLPHVLAATGHFDPLPGPQEQPGRQEAS